MLILQTKIIIMCIMKTIWKFAVRGVKSFHDASLGKYKDESQEVRELKEEMMNHPSSTATDRRNLRKDQRSVYRDIRKSYNKIVTGNV